MLEKRSTDLEIMDDLEISGEVIGKTLRELDFINQWLGGNAISLCAFRKMLKKGITSVTDLGCGSGDILLRMARIARKQDKQMTFLGADANPHITAYAKTYTQAFPEVTIKTLNIFSEEFQSQKTDVIHCCLFLHHFTESELVFLFKSFRQQVKVAIIVNDLHRHPLAFYSIKWLTALFSTSYMVKNDASLSVARGFRRNELIAILRQAGLTHYSLRWRWAFRWELIVWLH